MVSRLTVYAGQQNSESFSVFQLFMLDSRFLNYIQYFKDGLPHLFHGFTIKHFNKISLDNMLYFHNKLYTF